MSMEPLHWPEFYKPKQKEPKSFWEHLLVYWFSHGEYLSVVSNLKEQLAARSKPSTDTWGIVPSRVIMAEYVCATVKEEYDWPNDHFIPEDPFEIVFQVPWDDLEIVEFIMRVEEDLKIKIQDKEAEKWSGTLGDIVDFLVAKQEQAV